MRPNTSLLSSIGALVGLVASSEQPDSSGLQILLSSGDEICVHPPYQVQIVSSSPLVMYIKDFLTEQERAHLRAISINSFRHSVVADGKRSAQRTSQSTYVESDHVVRCIEERALAFQGRDVQPSQLEPLQLVKYAPGEHYHFHTDWFSDPAYKLAVNGGNRVSSFFAYIYVRNDTAGGGTNFPLLDPPVSDRWCDVVDCDEPYNRGLTFRPVEGNAVYWENLHPEDGSGSQKTLHAGLPVTTGEKIGMNIWTRQAPLSDEAPRLSRGES
ncbi:2OG-Fe(II) oxygenase superfamily protein [Lasiosphaeria ovina]|uniref:2OG-Fe(II) oxygenase superfamily protein n=1 Tax=Lasiosphaeria ovina TaxID=92902 RepID=A0AAE0N6V0_9PEZI|nr:2OG-Fe(II) oxygenase superfamily protein [Lasiosphaeria ovina]